MIYKPRNSADEIAAGMYEGLRSLGQYGMRYGGIYEQFKKELANALATSDKCAALKSVRVWMQSRNRAARLETEGKFGKAIQALVAAERQHNCGG